MAVSLEEPLGNPPQLCCFSWLQLLRLLTEIIPKNTFQRYSFSRLSFLSNSADVKSKKWWANEVWRLPYLLLFPHFLRFLGPDNCQLLHEAEPLHLLVRFQTKPRLLCTIRKGTRLTKKFGSRAGAHQSHHRWNFDLGRRHSLSVSADTELLSSAGTKGFRCMRRRVYIAKLETKVITATAEFCG